MLHAPGAKYKSPQLQLVLQAQMAADHSQCRRRQIQQAQRLLLGGGRDTLLLLQCKPGKEKEVSHNGRGSFPTTHLIALVSDPT